MKFYPYKKRGSKVLAMLKGGHNKFWGRFYTVRGANSFHSLKGGAKS